MVSRGIRSCVTSFLSCLPLLALLQSFPEDGDEDEGDLLPTKSGENPASRQGQDKGPSERGKFFGQDVKPAAASSEPESASSGPTTGGQGAMEQSVFLEQIQRQDAIASSSESQDAEAKASSEHAVKQGSPTLQQQDDGPVFLSSNRLDLHEMAPPAGTGNKGEGKIREQDADTTDLQGEGDLLPVRGEKEAVNLHQQDEQEGDLAAIDEGGLLPLSGDANQQVNGTLAEAEPEAEPDLLPTISDGELLLPTKNSALESLHIEEENEVCDLLLLFHNTCSAIIKIDVLKAYNFISLTPDTLQVARAIEPNPCMVHDDVVIVHAKSRVDPKVKKRKTSLLLCLTIHMPFHPGESGHDGCTPYHHHGQNTLTNESPFPPSHYHTHEPSSSAFSLLVSLTNDDQDATEVLEVTTMSMELPFTPLRGSKRCQVREMQTKLHEDVGMKTKIRMTKIRLSYITKDVLDPG